ncbi:MAG: hypothetical protein HZT40_12015 [Candidatus Thiothrix singaporensis]|uniref:Uncharacterized protein n=1 Tax=Candidatus Thiothrix singaporensis TaxID=2799669 RepID=A0A7L6ASU3_9GAMM|nr:MAG: hypothetical protein HZT40_12015 [Candidatus Thiothrix singaporensis]
MPRTTEHSHFPTQLTHQQRLAQDRRIQQVSIPRQMMETRQPLPESIIVDFGIGKISLVAVIETLEP